MTAKVDTCETYCVKSPCVTVSQLTARCSLIIFNSQTNTELGYDVLENINNVLQHETFEQKHTTKAIQHLQRRGMPGNTMFLLR